MKKSLFFRVLGVLLAVTMLCSTADVYAKSVFNGSYTAKDETVCEDPSNLFAKPKCFYKAQGLEIWGESSVTVNLPVDGDAVRALLFINTSDTILKIEPTSDPSVSGKMAEYTEEQLVIFHPNPLRMLLNPGESQRVTMTVAFGNNIHDVKENTLKSKLTISQEFGMSALMKTYRTPLENFSLSVPITVNVYTDSYMNSADNKKATVKGYVKDKDGKPINDARVTIQSAGVETEIRTNAKGYYSAKVFGIKNGYSKEWHEYVIQVEKNGYATQRTVVNPKNDKSVTCSFTMAKASKQLNYKQTKVIDLGVQAYSFDANTDGSVIAFIPFHSALPFEKLTDKMNLTVVSKSGKLLFQNKLPGETPYVDVAENGKYITTVKETPIDGNPNNSYSVPTIWNKSGEEVYSREYFPDNIDFIGSHMEPDGKHRIQCRVTKLSTDNSKLFVGTGGGEIYCIDWKNDEILWSAFLTNQVRTFDFSKDGNTVYVSAGNGYLYAYTMTGELLWKTFIASWATGVDVGEKYIAVTAKCDVSSLRLLDAKTGEQIWCYETPGRGCDVVLSPDEKLLWWGNDTSSAYTSASSIVLDTETGKIKYALDPGAQMADWSGDGKYLAAKTGSKLFVYDGATGETLWSTEVVEGFGQNAGSINFSLYFSDDAKYIVAAFNKDDSERSWGQAYFFQKQKK